MSLVMALLLLNTSLISANARVSGSKPKGIKDFTVIERIDGSAAIDLSVATEHLVLDLAKRSHIALRLRGVNQLFQTNENTGVIGINIYDDLTDELISSKRVALGGSRQKDKIFVSQDVGLFSTVSPSKTIRIEIEATDRDVVATFRTNIDAINASSQVASVQTSAQELDCSELSTEDCVKEFFIKKIDVVPDPNQKRAATVVQNEATDNIEIRVPVTKKFVKFNAGRKNISVNSSGAVGPSSGSGLGAGIANFGEVLDITQIRLGDSALDYANFRYDPTAGVANGEFIIGDGQNGSVFDNFYFSDKGKLGIGVSGPQAFVDVKAGTATMPQIRLAAGTLTTTPIDGALEFDGTDLYLTKGGVRAPVGSGSGGSSNLNNGAVVGGPLSFNANGSFVYPNGAQAGHVWTSTNNNGLAAWQPASALNVDNATTANFADVAGALASGATVNGSNIVNVNLDNSSIDNTTITNSNITNSNITNNTFNDNTVNGTLTLGSNAAIEGDLVVNGMVTATKFMGDGSMLTNINVANINGTVSAAENAQNAITANNLVNGNVTGTLITNSAMIGGTINGATLLNVFVDGAVADSATQLVDQFNSPALYYTTQGRLVATYDIVSNGTVLATAFRGDGSQLTNINANEITGFVGLCTNATTATRATRCDFMEDGEVRDSLIFNSHLNGGTIMNATLSNVTFEDIVIDSAVKLISPDRLLDVVLTDNNGDVFINEGSLTVNGMVTATKFIGDGSMITNINGDNIAGSIANAVNAVNATFAENINNGTVTNSSIDGSTITNSFINGVTLVNVSLNGFTADAATKLVSPDELVDPALEVFNNGSIVIPDGNLTVVGTVIADKFIGNGLNLTNINAANVVGTVPNATNAVSATSAVNAQTANFATTAQNMANGTIANSVINNTTINDSLINGATLINVSLNGVTATSAIALVSPDGSPDPAVAVDNNGNITITEGNLDVLLGEIAAEKFIGDGSMLTSLSGNSVVGPVANAINAQTATSAANADNAINAVNMINGTLSNSEIITSEFIGGVINGALLVNVDLNGAIAAAALSLAAPGGAVNPAVSVDTNGNVTVEQGNLVVNGTVTANKFIGNGAMLTNLSGSNVIGPVDSAINAINTQFAQSATTAVNAQNVINGTITNTNIIGGVINGATLINTSFNGVVAIQATSLASPDGSVDPAASVDIDGNILVTQGNLTVNGEVIAQKFTGDGSMLTNLDANNITGTVNNAADAVNALNAVNAVTAQNADFATNATTATNVVNGSILNVTVDGSTILNSNIDNTSITDGIINGATLVNVTISGANVEATKLVAPDGDPDPAVSVDNDGNVAVEVGDLTVNGMVTATKFIGDGSMLTNIDAASINGVVAQATNAVSAQNALTADLATTATNLANGTVTNATIENSVLNSPALTAADIVGGLINGATLINVTFAGGEIEATKLVSPDGAIDPAVSVDNNGDVFVEVGNLTVNGMLTAAKFMGDGSMLTNILGSNVNGAVAEAISAQSAQTALTAATATTATNVVNGNISNVTVVDSSISNSNIDNTTINNGVINGATLVNVTLAGGTVDATKLVSPDGSPDPAVSVDNNGNVFVEAGDLTVNGDVLADKFIGDGSMLTNINASGITGPVAQATNATNAQNALTADQAASVVNGTVSNSTIDNSTITFTGLENSTFTGGVVNGAALININFAQDAVEVSKLVSADGSVNPAVSVANNGDVFIEVGNLTVNGMVTAAKFMGDGSMLTNIQGSAVNGAVAEAINALNAQNAVTATNATNATNLVNGNISNATVVDSSISNSSVDNTTINNGVINGATLVNVTFAGGTLDATKLVAPDGDPDPAVSVDINGHVLVENGDLTVNGMVTAIKFMGDGSMLTNIQGSSVVGPVAQAINAQNANTASTADFATTAQNLVNGTITNANIIDSTITSTDVIGSTFINGVINGATLVNATIAGGTLDATKLVSPDGSVDPAVSVDNNGYVLVENGDLTVNGMVTAIKFMGDGSMLTNISGDSINGAVAEAIASNTANTAVTADTALTATNLVNGTITNAEINNSTVSNSTIDDVTINNGIINGATLVNITLNGGLINATELVTENGDTAISVDNDGNVFVENGDLTVNGMVTAIKFMGDGSMLTNIQGSSIVGPVAEATNAQNAVNADYALNADNATNATNADNAQNVINGTIINSTIIGGVINGADLFNVDIADVDVSKLVSPDGNIDPVAFVDNNGNLSVGVDNPLVKLDVDGAIRPGYDDRECNEDLEGAIRYNPDEKVIQFCNCEEWISVVDDPTVEDRGECEGEPSGRYIVGPNGKLNSVTVVDHHSNRNIFYNRNGLPTFISGTAYHGTEETAQALCERVAGTNSNHVRAERIHRSRWHSPHDNFNWVYNSGTDNFDRINSTQTDPCNINLFKVRCRCL